MMVVIANKLRDTIESSDLKDIEHKSAVGCYEIATFVKNLRNLEFDKLLIDITAIKDAEHKESWDMFTELVDQTNTLILYDASNCDSVILSNLVNRGFYNFGSTTEEILELLEHPNMLADVQKYIVSTTNARVVPVPVVEKISEPVKTQEPFVIDKSILKEFRDEYKIDFDKENMIPRQLLCTLLVFVLLIAVTIVEKWIFGFKPLAQLLAKTSIDALRGLIILTIIIILNSIAVVPLIRIIKKKNNSILRVLLVPALLSYPLAQLILLLFSKYNSSIEDLLNIALIFSMYIPFVGLLLVNGAVKSWNSENVDIVKWNIFEKIGVILVIYIFIIPLSQFILTCMGVTLFDGIYSFLYFSNAKTNVISYIFTVLGVIIPLLIMISRVISRRRRIN